MYIVCINLKFTKAIFMVVNSILFSLFKFHISLFYALWFVILQLYIEQNNTLFRIEALLSAYVASPIIAYVSVLTLLTAPHEIFDLPNTIKP